MCADWRRDAHTRNSAALCLRARCCGRVQTVFVSRSYVGKQPADAHRALLLQHPLNTPPSSLASSPACLWPQKQNRQQGYTKLLHVLGSNIAEFLQNLNNLHLHLSMGWPSMVAPAFRCEQVRRRKKGVLLAGGQCVGRVENGSLWPPHSTKL